MNVSVDHVHVFVGDCVSFSCVSNNWYRIESFQYYSVMLDIYNHVHESTGHVHVHVGGDTYRELFVLDVWTPVFSAPF